MKRINITLLFLLAFGTTLRFYGYPHIPFTYDELSAWGRTGYTNFAGLINMGVRGDGHPALIQVFLNYWRMLFGDSEAAFKLPFLLMGVACIYLIYYLGTLWFSETAGLICASYFAVLQYTVLYSQVARPYISGLFFSLLMVIAWYKYVFGGLEKSRKKYLISFILFAALCCYNHYFSFLFAFMVGLSGLFFLSGKKLIEYIVAGLLIALLFVPHIGITLDQFEIGGVGGWLSKPDSTFFKSYLSYVFDFSPSLIWVTVAVTITGLVMIAPHWRQKNHLRLLCFIWFIVPVIIGYFYSVFRNPVLQYSVLIFSFPFLLLFLFSFYRNIKRWQQAMVAAIIVIVGTYSLIVVRRHYEIFYKQPVEQMVKSTIMFANAHPGKKVVSIIQEPEKYMSYYLKKWNSDVQIYSWQDLNFQSYGQAEQFIKSQNADYVLCGNVPYDHLILIKDLFPNLVEADKGFTYEFFGYGKPDATEKPVNQIAFSDSLNFISPGKFWTGDMSRISTDSSGARSYHFDASREFGPTFTAWLHDIMQKRDDILLINLKVKNVSPKSQASLVVSLEQQRDIAFYQEKNFSLFIDSTAKSGSLVFALRFRDYELTKTNPLLNAYIWNKNHESFDVVSMKIEIIKGNPLIYSLIEPIVQ